MSNGQLLLQQKGNLESKIYAWQRCWVFFSQRKPTRQPETGQSWEERITEVSKQGRKACQPFLPLSTLALQDAYREQKGRMEMAKKKLNSQSFFTHLLCWFLYKWQLLLLLNRNETWNTFGSQRWRVSGDTKSKMRALPVRWCAVVHWFQTQEQYGPTSVI